MLILDKKIKLKTVYDNVIINAKTGIRYVLEHIKESMVVGIRIMLILQLVTMEVDERCTGLICKVA